MNETGSQVVSYKGNADLGYGADGIAYAGNSDEAFKNLSNIFSEAATRNLQWNTLKYQQQVKDRDTLLTTLQQADAAIDMPMDERDRKVLNDQYNSIKQILIDHPNITAESNYEAMTKMLAAKNDLVGKAAMAKVRYKGFTDQRTDIANEVNPIVRQDMQDHFAQQYNTNIYHAPDPFMKATDWDDKILMPDPPQKVIEDKPVLINGLWYKQTVTRPDIKAMIDHYDPANTIHPVMSNQIGAKYDFVSTNKDFQSNANLASINKVLNQANEDQANSDPNFNDQSKYYLSPIATQDADGNYHLIGTKADINKKLYVAAKYKETHNAPVYDEALMKGYKLKAETDKDIAGAQKDIAGAKNELAQANEHNTKAWVDKYLAPAQKDAENALAEQRRAAKNKDEFAMTKEEGLVAKPVADAIQSWTDIDNQKQFRTGKVFLEGLKATMSPPEIDDFKKNYGITDESKIIDVPLTNSVAIKMVSSAAKDDKGHTVITKPVKMWAVKNSDDGDGTTLIGVTADSKVTTTNFSDGINNLISMSNGGVGKNDVTQQGAALRYINKLQGADYGEVSYKRIRESLEKGPKSNAPTVTKIRSSSSSTTPATTLPAQQQPAAPAEVSKGTVPIEGAKLKKINGVINVYSGGKWHPAIKKASGLIHYK
jgi:hypothetical protein